MARIPCPHNPKFAKLLLEYIKYGLTLHHITMSDGNIVLYIKTPEHIVISDDGATETLTGDQLARRFKECVPFVKIAQFIGLSTNDIINDTSNKCIVKRAPYKNEFDDWNEEFGEQALEEYKTLMLGYFNEEDLL